jgi:uncharacterized membrane protein YeaQ/YmgE (transglycosylase-associated protein family)
MDQGVVILSLIVGAIVGWMAARVLKRTGFGVVGDIIVGMIGGYVGTWLWTVLPSLPEVGPFPVKDIVASTIGALVLLVLWRLVAR